MATISLSQPGGGGSQSTGGTIFPGARCYPAFSSTATSYVWSLQSTPSGSATTMLSASGLVPYFDPDIAGTYAFRLVATGGSDAGTYDATVVCIARNQVTPPTGYLASYEPDFMGATVSTLLSCNTNTSGIVSFVPFVLPQPMAVGAAEIPQSLSFVTAGNSNASYTHSQSWGIYSRVGGSTGTVLTQMMASSFVLAVSANNSTYSVNQPTSTWAAGYSTGLTTSAGSSMTSAYTGAKLIQLPVNLTLSAGQYWLGLGNFGSSSSTSGGISASYIGLAGIATMATLAPIGSYSSAYSTGTLVPSGLGGNWNLGLASFTSVGQTNLPASVGISLLTQNVFVQPFLEIGRDGLMSAVFYGNVGAAALSYEPYPINNVNTTLISAQTNTSGPCIFYPFSLPGPVAVGCVDLAASMSFLTAGNSSATQVLKLSYGLYSRGTGTNSSTIGSMTSGIMSVLATANNSSYTLSHGTSTGSNAYTYSTTNSAGSNISSQYTGMKMIQLPVGMTLSAGQYWLGLFHQNSTATTTHGVAISLLGYVLPNTMTVLAPMGSLTTAYSTGTNVGPGVGGNWQLGLGSYTSAAQTNLPASVALSNLTCDISNMPYMRFVSTL